MRKLIYLLLFLVCLGVVVAGNTVKIDFNENSRHLVVLERGDRVEFNLNNARHTVILDKIKSGSVDITSFINVDELNVPFYATISKERALKLDIERDDVTDLYIKLYGIKDGKAALLLEKPGESLTGAAVKELKEGEFVREKRNYDWLVVGFLVLIGVLFVFLVFWNRKKD